MKKLKLFLCVALFGAMSFGALSAYEHLTMSEEERFLLANVEALTNDGESGSGGSGCYVSLACSMVNAEQNKISCNGSICRRNPAERWVECDGSRTSCDL